MLQEYFAAFWLQLRGQHKWCKYKNVQTFDTIVCYITPFTYIFDELLLCAIHLIKSRV